MVILMHQRYYNYRYEFWILVTRNRKGIIQNSYSFGKLKLPKGYSLKNGMSQKYW